MSLTIEQQKAFDAVLKERSIIVTGCGGSGKSYLITKIIQWAKESNKNFGVTATTGSAAVLIGGTTIHSFLGIGLGKKSPEYLANMIQSKKRFVYNRIRRLEVLIIDEISMMNAALMDLISKVLCIVRGNLNCPFGGVQIILSGDLFQLPPVEGDLLFKSNTWNDFDIEIIELTSSQRHKDDQLFMKMLKELRWGRCTPEILKVLKETKHNTFPSDIQPTILYSRNCDVDAINSEKYQKLIDDGARSFSYATKYSSESAKIWAQSSKIPETVEMCIGAQVLLTWNVDLEAGLCNGSRGIVVDVGIDGVIVKFTSNKLINIPFIQVENEDNKNIWVSFMPLRLAYALTVNKSQGMTIDCAIVFLDKNYNNEFGYGRAYTALSRVRSLDNVRIINVSENSFKAHPEVIEFYQNIC